MASNGTSEKGIPPSVSLETNLDSDSIVAKSTINKKRILFLSALAFIISVLVSFIAKFLIGLINLITNIAFYGRLSLEEVSPAGNDLGLFFIIRKLKT